MSLSLIAYTEERKYPNLRLFSVISLLAVSTILNVLMIQRVHSLGQVISQLKSGNRLEPGTLLGTLEAESLDGSKVALRFSDRTTPTVVYVFTPQCSWCQRNLNNLKAVSAATSNRFNLIGVSLSEEGLADYVKKNSFDFPVYSNVSDASKRAFRLSGTPQTLVIGNDNRLVKNWMGVYTGSQQKEVEDYFAIKLPGLIEAPAHK